MGKGGVNGGVQWGMASDGRNLYAATSDVVRRGAAGYDPKEGGGLTALRIRDGQKVWYAAPPPCDDKKGCSPAQSAARQCDSWRGFLRVAGRAPAGLLHGRRQGPVGFRYGSRLHHGERRQGERRRRGWSGRDCGGRDRCTSARATRGPAAWAGMCCWRSGRVNNMKLHVTALLEPVAPRNGFASLEPERSIARFRWRWHAKATVQESPSRLANRRGDFPHIPITPRQLGHSAGIGRRLRVFRTREHRFGRFTHRGAAAGHHPLPDDDLGNAFDARKGGSVS